jgi:hypothetical protein
LKVGEYDDDDCYSTTSSLLSINNTTELILCKNVDSSSQFSHSSTLATNTDFLQTLLPSNGRLFFHPSHFFSAKSGVEFAELVKKRDENEKIENENQLKKESERKENSGIYWGRRRSFNNKYSDRNGYGNYLSSSSLSSTSSVFSFLLDNTSSLNYESSTLLSSFQSLGALVNYIRATATDSFLLPSARIVPLSALLQLEDEDEDDDLDILNNTIRGRKTMILDAVSFLKIFILLVFFFLSQLQPILNFFTVVDLQVFFFYYSIFFFRDFYFKWIFI